MAYNPCHDCHVLTEVKHAALLCKTCVGNGTREILRQKGEAREMEELRQRVERLESKLQ